VALRRLKTIEAFIRRAIIRIRHRSSRRCSYFVIFNLFEYLYLTIAISMATPAADENSA
jgi:hypothetical protein